ncbi:SgcJ/EcaC family oxidoreductase [candidate division KSB1 bacterium]|nr:SgcJ/EcaC family oxidoreductase [candidate division KSB1 bacterium]
MNTLFHRLCNFLRIIKPGDDESSSEVDLAAIQKLHETDMAAAKIHDIHTLITLVTNDCILLPPKLEPIRGREAIWKFMQEQLPENQKYAITEYIQHFEEVKIIGDWAYEWANFHGTYHLKSGGSELQERSRLFRILRRQTDGSWKVARVIWQEME